MIAYFLSVMIAYFSTSYDCFISIMIAYFSVSYDCLFFQL